MIRRTYILYDKNDIPLIVGNIDEIADYLGSTTSQVYSRFSKFRAGVTQSLRNGIKMYEVKDDE